jgi:hypothetical protein
VDVWGLCCAYYSETFESESKVKRRKVREIELGNKYRKRHRAAVQVSSE